MEQLQTTQQTLARLAADVGPSVVGVGRSGSGVVIATGSVLTNAHAVRHEDVRIRFSGGRTESGRLAGADVDGDIAVIAVETGEVQPIEWSDEAPTIGTPVVALANPRGRGLHVTLGYVSTAEARFRSPRGRWIRDSIEHTAPLPRGSSGSPIVDVDGRLLGINTVRLEGGLILAIAAGAALHARADALARGETPSRPTLGVALASPRVARRLRGAVGLPERDGLLVRRVLEGSPAERAGIQRGDLLVEVAGAPVTGVDDIYRRLDDAGPEGALELALVRGTEDRTVEVKLG